MYLHEAAYLFKDLHLVVYLLSLKNATMFYTSLLTSHEFLSACDSEIFKMLVKLGADYNATLANFANAPFVCVLARLGQFRLLSELVKLTNLRDEAIYGYEDRKGTSCLCYATQYDRFECAKFLIENNAAQSPQQMITKVDSTGYCALAYACEAKKDLRHFVEYYLSFLNTTSAADIRCLLSQALVLCSLNSNVNCLNYLVRGHFIILGVENN